MTTIWKYTFDIVDRFGLALPKGASILHVDMQAGYPRLWALVDPTRRTVLRRFFVAGTGHPLPEDEAWQWLFTFQAPPHVWHLFELAGSMPALR